MKGEPKGMALKSPFVPQFARDLSDVMHFNGGSLTKAMQAIFENRKIQIKVVGDTSVFTEGGEHNKNGILVVGDHRQGLESAPALAFLGMMGRSDVSFLAKPYSIPARLINSALGSSLAKAGERPSSSPVLPVVPPSLTADVPAPFFSGDSFFKFVNRFSKRKLLSLKEALKVNLDSIREAARQLEQGHCIVMSPTSRIRNPLDSDAQWEKGLAMMLARVAPAHRERVKVVPARFDDFSRSHLIYSLLGKERLKRPLELTLRLGKPQALGEILGGNGIRETDAILAKVREHFATSFE